MDQSITNISNDSDDNWEPQISGSNVVWWSDADGDFDIYFYDGTNITNISDNTHDDAQPQISGSNVVWHGNADGDYDIYFYDGTSVTNLSNDSRRFDVNEERS